MSFSSVSDPREAAELSNAHGFVKVPASDSNSSMASRRPHQTEADSSAASAVAAAAPDKWRRTSASQFVSSRTPIALTPAFFALICEETMNRTQLQCDEMTSFQRVVSFRVAEMHGRWGFSQETGEPNEYCALCGQDMNLHKRESARTHPLQRAVDLRAQRLDTPCCGLKELYGNGCKYADSVATMLQRRADFNQAFSPIAERMHKASNDIRGTVPNYIV